MNVNVPYERFEELIRAEILLELEYESEDSKKKRRVQRKSESKGREYAEKVLKEMIRFIVKRAFRKGQYYYVNDIPFAGIHGGKLCIRDWTLEKIKSDYLKSHDLSLDLDGTSIVRKQANGSYFKQVNIPKRLTGGKQINMRCWVIENEVLEEMNLYYEVFKIEKVDRDQFEYRR